MEQSLNIKIQEQKLEWRKRKLRSECNLAKILTEDEWYTEKVKEIKIPEPKIISKEEVLKEIEEIKKIRR